MDLRPRNEAGPVLGLLVVLLRSLRRWSQAELARASGAQKSQISLYELGRTVPSEATLRKFAAACGGTWADVCTVLPALRALHRLATRPVVGRAAFPPDHPTLQRTADAVGRAAAETFARNVLPFLCEHLPAFLPADRDPALATPTRPADPNVEPAALGLLLVLLRSLRHWSQVQLASASGVQRSQISVYELGEAKPRERTLERLAEALNVPLGEALETLPFLRELLAANRGSSGWRSGPATSASAASSASPADAVGRLAANLVHLEVRPAVARYVSAGDAGAKT